VFGAAFGNTYVDAVIAESSKPTEMTVSTPTSKPRKIPVVDSDRLMEQHGKCFFLFVQSESLDSLRETESKTDLSPMLFGHYWLIPLDRTILPYKNPRRNAKLLKYMGHSAFLNDDHSESSVSPGHIVWQDAKFYRPGFLYSIPRDYASTLRSWADFDPRMTDATHQQEEEQQQSNDRIHLPCLTTMGLPASHNSFEPPIGSEISTDVALSSYSHPHYKDHCQTVIRALSMRPDVTDSPHALMNQCQIYLQYVHQMQEQQQQQSDGINEKDRIGPLDLGLIDSAFLVWKESTQECRDFNAALRCSMLDQLHCHSDRDQVLFPMVIHKLLEKQKEQHSENDESSNTTNNAEEQPETQSQSLSDVANARNHTDQSEEHDDSHSSPYHLQATYFSGNDDQLRPVDMSWKSHVHDLDLVPQQDDPNGEEHQQVFVRITRSSCHWYYYEQVPNQPLGERFCGHRVWIKKSLENTHPSLEQERTIRHWSSSPSTPTEETEDFRETLGSSQDISTKAPMLLNDRNRDTVDQPYKPDFYQCTSPEFDSVPWPFRPVPSDAPTITDTSSEEGSWPTCGASSGEPLPFHKSLREKVWEKYIRHLANKDRCSDLLVFGEALGVNTKLLIGALEMKTFKKEAKQMVLTKQSKMQLNHGNCFFLFVLEDDLKAVIDGGHVFSKPRTIGNDVDVVMSGHFVLIPVDRTILPYESMPRNSRLFRYSVQFLFPDAKTVIYQDINFLSPDYSLRLPINYHHLYPRRTQATGIRSVAKEPCVTVFSLPRNSKTVGRKSNISPRDGLFEGHCKYLLNAHVKKGTEKDRSVTESLVQQCDAYLQYVYKRELTTNVLDHGTIDTNFMSWNEGTDYCRDFNAKLRCTILDQLHCHSHLDRIAFPFALYVQYQMGLEASALSPPTMNYQPKSGREPREPVNNRFDQNIHNLNFVQNIVSVAGADPTSTKEKDMVLILRKSLHWTEKFIGPGMSSRQVSF